MTDHKFTEEQIIEALEIRMPHDAICREAYDCIIRQKAEIESLNAVHADMTESLRLAAEANKDMTVELQALRGAANSYKMHYEEAQAELADLRTIVFTDRSEAIEANRKKIKAEAIKEFAERLKKRLERKYTIYGREYVLRHLRDLVKEMTELDKTEFSD